MAGMVRFRQRGVGDMAIHNMDPAFYALDLDAPTAVEPDQSAEKRIVSGLADSHL